MASVKTIREAKEYLARRIAAEAEREGTPLSEVERKMLYFTESGWTLPKMMQVSAEFDRDCDQGEYEQKIAKLVHALEEQNSQNELEQEAWDDAVVTLSKEDHYLTVLVNLATPRSARSRWLPTFDAGAERPSGDVTRLVLVALGVVLALSAILFLWPRLFGPK